MTTDGFTTCLWFDGQAEDAANQGVSWQVIPKRFVEMMDDPDPEKVKRAAEAMLEMKKLEIAPLEKAYVGD